MSKGNKYKDVEKKAPEPNRKMEVVRIISQHKRARGRMVDGRYTPPKPIAHGHKRVEAIVRYGSSRRTFTRHIDIPK